MAKGCRKETISPRHVTPISLGPNIGGSTDPLSARERDVVRLMAQGLSDVEISQALFISVHTAQWHAKSIRRKLGLRNRVQIAAWRYGLGMMNELAALGLPAVARCLLTRFPPCISARKTPIIGGS